MFTTVSCFLLAAFPTLAVELTAVNEEDASYTVERNRPELFSSDDERNGESLVYKAKNIREESFKWRDCGDSRTLVRITSFSISPLPLQLPGKVVIALNATVTSDIEAPISLKMRLKKKAGPKWIRFCKLLPGGCRRQDICKTSSSSSAAAAAATEEEHLQVETQNPLCHMQKGNFTLPPTPFAVTVNASSGWYTLMALFRKGDQRIACIYMQINVAEESHAGVLKEGLHHSSSP